MNFRSIAFPLGATYLTPALLSCYLLQNFLILFSVLQEELISRLDHRINCLKAEQATIVEESRINDQLGETISKKVAELASAPEAAKYKLHIEEIGHITSLLLGLSGRLAKVENSLQELPIDDQIEKVSQLNLSRYLDCFSGCYWNLLRYLDSIWLSELLSDCDSA